jgi:dipeptidyl aminopeptidase/acylaminoacyl peptidase
LGKEVVYAKYAGEGHVLKGSASIVDFWSRVLNWFDNYMKSE